MTDKTFIPEVEFMEAISLEGLEPNSQLADDARNYGECVGYNAAASMANIRIRSVKNQLDSFKFAFEEWYSKTEWVQSRDNFPFPQLGMHRADVMTKYIQHLEAALKGDQVPVAVVELNDNITVAEMRGDIPRRKAVRELYEGALVIGQELFTTPQKPVVVLADCDIGAVSHMAHWYSEEQCEAWVAGAEHVRKQVEAAGITVKGGELPQ